MNKRQRLFLVLSAAILTLIPLTAQAAEITTCIFNRSVYYPGETGYISVTIYNNEDSTIRVTELTLNIDYYYESGNAYIQTFYYPTADLPVEVQQGQTETLYLSFTLPNNIASGYTTPFVKAKTERWHNYSQTWLASEHPTYQPTFYIESPYRQLFEEQQTLNDQLQQQYQELQALNTTTTNMMYLLAITTTAFAAIAVLFIIFSRKARVMPQSTA